ncbi:alpha/beta hydrolase family protein [Epilithonimonas sp.]|uniref:alpha/beta hydrolase family protein n=1 Tax=Epilithonimonas sp. TaxID=2894511 RepID=UPI002FDEBBA2
MKVFLTYLGFLFCCLYKAQSKDQIIPDSLKRHYYNISFPKISPNEKYVTFNKAYDTSSDTLVVIDRNSKNLVIFEGGNILANNVNFTINGNLLMRQGKNLQMLLLPSLKLKVWKDSQDYAWIRELNLIFLLQGKVLKIIDGEGKENDSINEVISIKKVKNTLYFTTQDNNETYSLHEWNLKNTKKLYSSTNSKMEIKYQDQAGFFIWEKNESNQQGQLSYVSAESNQLFHCTNFRESIKNIDIAKLENDKYYIHYYPEIQSKPKETMEVWYGNDNKIQTKFFEDYIGKYFILSTKTGNSSEILDQKLTHHAYIGSSRYLLSFDPYYKHDYTKRFPTFNLHRYDTVLNKFDFIVDSGSMVFTDPKGQWVLTHNMDGKWKLYEVATLKGTEIPLDKYENAYFSKDGKTILFEGLGQVYEYQIAKKKLQNLPLKLGYRNKVKNGNMQSIISSYNIFRSSYDSHSPVIIDLYDRDNIKNAWVSLGNNSVKDLIEITDDDVSSVEWSEDLKKLIYVKSNINKPPQLILGGDRQEEILYESNSKDMEAKHILSKMITYKNSRGEPLKGVLIFPLNFKKEKKYPMVVAIYQKLRYMANKYNVDGIGMNFPTEGINVRSLLRKGYFVYMPDVVFDSRGTGRSALDCITNAMKALNAYNFIDFKKVALIGHSHGGYETNFIATQSNLFATYISGAGNSDLVRSYHSFNYNFSRPFFWQFEDGQYEMPESFTDNKMLYIDNSPIYHSQTVQKPILLWTGKKDFNIFWEQTMEFYLGLRRNHKRVIALFYPDDGHNLFKINNRIDLYSRISDWLDFHLKDKDVRWINEMNK